MVCIPAPCNIVAIMASNMEKLMYTHELTNGDNVELMEGNPKKKDYQNRQKFMIIFINNWFTSNSVEK